MLLRLSLLVILLWPSVQAVAQESFEVAITLDDLPAIGTSVPSEQKTLNQKILAILKRFDVKATGFVNECQLYVGHGSDTRINILKTWIDEGHDLGNHTYSHNGLRSDNLEAFQADTLRGEQVFKPLMQKAGREKLYFRYPYLQNGKTPEIRAAFESFLDRHGYTVAPITIDTKDWKFNKEYKNNPKKRHQIIQKYIQHTQTTISYYEGISKRIFGRNIKHVLLLHNNHINADCLDKVLATFKRRGYKFITLTQALADEAYLTNNLYYSEFGTHWLYNLNQVDKRGVNWVAAPDKDNLSLFNLQKTFFDPSIKREVTVQLYFTPRSKMRADSGIPEKGEAYKLPIAIISCPSRKKSPDFHALAQKLANTGHFVIRVNQPQPTSDKANNQDGNGFINFVNSVLKDIKLKLDFNSVIYFSDAAQQGMPMRLNIQ